MVPRPMDGNSNPRGRHRHRAHPGRPAAVDSSPQWSPSTDRPHWTPTSLVPPQWTGPGPEWTGGEPGTGRIAAESRPGWTEGPAADREPAPDRWAAAAAGGPSADRPTREQPGADL